jgi:hypothetical protein
MEAQSIYVSRESQSAKKSIFYGTTQTLSLGSAVADMASQHANAKPVNHSFASIFKNRNIIAPPEKAARSLQWYLSVGGDIFNPLMECGF